MEIHLDNNATVFKNKDFSSSQLKTIIELSNSLGKSIGLEDCIIKDISLDNLKCSHKLAIRNCRIDGLTFNNCKIDELQITSSVEYRYYEGLEFNNTKINDLRIWGCDNHTDGYYDNNTKTELEFSNCKINSLELIDLGSAKIKASNTKVIDMYGGNNEIKVLDLSNCKILGGRGNYRGRIESGQISNCKITIDEVSNLRFDYSKIKGSNNIFLITKDKDKTEKLNKHFGSGKFGTSFINMIGIFGKGVNINSNTNKVGYNNSNIIQSTDSKITMKGGSINIVGTKVNGADINITNDKVIIDGVKSGSTVIINGKEIKIED